MTAQQTVAPRELLRSVESKLQAFHDGLSAEEKPIFQEILVRAADDDVVAHMPEGGAPTGGAGTGTGTTPSVSGTFGGVKFTVTPGNSLTKVTDGVTTQAQPGGTTNPSGRVTGGISISFGKTK